MKWLKWISPAVYTLSTTHPLNVIEINASYHAHIRLICNAWMTRLLLKTLAPQTTTGKKDESVCPEKMACQVDISSMAHAQTNQILNKEETGDGELVYILQTESIDQMCSQTSQCCTMNTEKRKKKKARDRSRTTIVKRRLLNRSTQIAAKHKTKLQRRKTGEKSVKHADKLPNSPHEAIK